MLAAEFGYSEEFIDESMDMEKFEGHARYREQCPPAGMMFRLFMESFGDSESSGSPSTEGQKKSPAIVSGKEAIAAFKAGKPIPESKSNMDEVNAFAAMMGAGGMQIRKKGS